ncbi:hypothetical protein HMPREF9237_00715 [Actinotignum schaalii FB123-CNA-2]|uniref:Uncharacterized protein n=1 Tax=Actinotignum schaalii FB123-CNA-2 TaxID=883067 RepID=S2VJ68_9ACTO|nr:hypothetical protein HMPREF9237_00715 [Actinotignum schaalii FB123-CNA-2]
MTAELPPLARGRAETTICPIDPSGITPARAGKSADRTARHCGHGNYPRSRGEENTRGKHLHIFRELPPLARGRVNSAAFNIAQLGITPARAGKRPDPGPSFAKAGNYPRSRGEEELGVRGGYPCVELPPLARGRDAMTTERRRHRGITPARAGKSPTLGPVVGKVRNYPRSRGEENTPPHN